MYYIVLRTPYIVRNKYEYQILIILFYSVAQTNITSLPNKLLKKQLREFWQFNP